MKVDLVVPTESWLADIWDKVHQDVDGKTGLPPEMRVRAGFFRKFNEWAVAEEFGGGVIRLISLRTRIAGFVSWSPVPTEYLPSGVTAVECGTYLLPEFRGRGVNQSLKKLQLQVTFDKYGVDWAVFVVQARNVRAGRAMTKLPWKCHVEPQSNEEMSARSDLFARFRQRKTWEDNQPCMIYAFAREAFYLHQNPLK